MSSRIFYFFGLLSMSVLSGLFISFFLHGLVWITDLRISQPGFIYTLPLVSYLSYFLYQKAQASEGLSLVFQNIARPSQTIRWSMAPLILITTWLSHLGGASVGREGSALQIASANFDLMGRRLSSYERSCFLSAALSAGFSAAMSVPFAGLVFGLESSSWREISWLRFFSCMLASAVSYLVTRVWPTAHIEVELFWPNQFRFSFFFALFVISLVFTGFSLSFKNLLERFHILWQKLIPKTFYRLGLGSLLLVLMFSFDSMRSYSGLGVSYIESYFHVPADWWVALVKMMTTIASLGFEFKGGEFTPLVYMSTSLASSMASFLDLPLSFIVALCYCLIYSLISKSPVAGAILVAETFSWKLLIFSLPLYIFTSLLFGVVDRFLKPSD